MQYFQKTGGGALGGAPPVYPLPVPFLSLPAPSRPALPEGTRSVSLTNHQSRVTSHGSHPLSTTEQSTSPSVMYIVPVLSSPLCRPGDRPFLLRRRPP